MMSLTEIEELKAKLAIAVEALEFYAATNSLDKFSDDYTVGNIILQYHDKAKEALQKIRGEKL